MKNDNTDEKKIKSPSVSSLFLIISIPTVYKVVKNHKNNLYKDKLRTIEIMARMKMKK